MKHNDRDFEQFLEDSSSDEMRAFILRAIKEKVLLLKDMIQVATNCYRELPEDSNIRSNYEYFIVQLMTIGLESFRDFDLFIGSDDEEDG